MSRHATDPAPAPRWRRAVVRVWDGVARWPVQLLAIGLIAASLVSVNVVARAGLDQARVVPGPTETVTVPGPTRTVPGPRVTETVHEPGPTVYVPGATVTRAGPTRAASRPGKTRTKTATATATVTMPSDVEPYAVTDLTFHGDAWDRGLSADEFIAFDTDPDHTSGMSQAASGAWHTDLTQPSACGRTIDADWTDTPITAVEVTYRNDPAGLSQNIGGVYAQFSAASLGGVLDFGPIATTDWEPGDRRVIQVDGDRLARLTYVDGPTNGNAPHSKPAASSGCAGSGNAVWMHTASTNAADQPITLRLEFFEMH